MVDQGFIVTIDGPAGSGKSTAARELAKRLGFEYLDTGAMYRAVALALARAGIDDADQVHVASFLAGVSLEMPPGKVLLNAEDVTQAIRTDAISAASSKIAIRSVIRAYLADRQRAIARGRRMVCEGRDQGTAVFPEAPCKFYLDANLETRARRRQAELLARGETVSLEQVIQGLEERDQRDSSRETAPLKPAPDAIIVDTSLLNPEQVVDRLVESVRQCIHG